MSSHNSVQLSQPPLDPRAHDDRSIGQDLDNIFRLTAAQFQAPGYAADRAPAKPAEQRRVTQPDLDAALDMLNRAAKAMDLMQSRYQHVENYAKGVAGRAEKDVEQAKAQAREWELRATGSEEQIEQLRARAIEAERRAEAAERHAKEARDWLECFYDKIVSSFDTRSFVKSQAA